MKRYIGIKHIKDNVYEINFRPYPKADRIWKRVRAGSMREAYTIRASLMSHYEIKSISTGVNFTDLRGRLENKLKADNLSLKTIKNLMCKYRNFFEEYLPKFHSHITNVDQITRETIEAYKQYVVVERGRVTGWRDELTKLKVIVKKLVDIGCCDKDIYYDVLGSFKRPQRTKKLYKEITRPQMIKLLNYIKKNRPDYYGITYLIMRLGWRRGQVISIKRNNIKWHGLKPIEILIEPQDTKNKEPFILRNIDEELAKVIKQYAFDRRKTMWLFPNRNNNKQHENHYTEYIRKISKVVLDFTLSPHDFRHSFCTTRLKEGNTEKDIMAITGHKDTDSFKIYTHPTSAGTKKVIEESKLF